MNSLQITNILQNSASTKDCFKGVFASNNIKVFNKYPYAVVANTDRMGERGTHWIGMYIPRTDTIEYFDSFAEPPNADIQKYLDNFKNVKMNKRKIQSVYDNSCGSHVIYFLAKRCQGETFENIINSLSTSSFSDPMVKLFVFELVRKGI